MHNTEAKEEVDVAVVGAGPAGCYVAWRMAEAAKAGLLTGLGSSNTPLKIRLYEYSDRVGGRIHSIKMQSLPNIAVEMGAEGYLQPPAPELSPPQYTGHVLVASLVSYLNMTAVAQHRRGFHGIRDKFLDEQLEPTRVGMGGAANPLFLRNQRLMFGDLGDPAKVPYQLTWTEGVNLTSATGLLGYAINQIIPHATSMSSSELREACRTATWKGTPLYQHEIGGILREVLSPDGYQFLLDTADLPSALTGYNASNAIDFLLNNTLAPLALLHIQEGYDELPKQLVQRFLELQPKGFQPHHSVSEIEAEEDGRMVLRFASERGKEPKHVRARAVVLGLPKAALEKISLRGRDFDGPEGTRFHTYKDAVEPLPVQRVYASYPYPWWQRTGVTSGPGAITAPIRITFALDTQGTQPGAPNPDDQHSLFLVAFNEVEEAPAAGTEAARLQGESEQQQVRELYGLDYIPKPVDQARMLWGKQTVFGGAWHRWRPGYQSAAVGHCMRKPFERLRLHVVGEAYSEVQGWTEGALATSEQMLREYYGLEPLPQLMAR